MVKRARFEGWLRTPEPHRNVAAWEWQDDSTVKLFVAGWLLVLPHPAYRVITNALLDEARTVLGTGFGRLALRQGRGLVVRDELY